MEGPLASSIRAANATLLGSGDLDAVGEFFAPDYVAVLVEGEDRIAWQRTLRGTHEGSFMGFPASGQRTVWRDMVTSRFHDGLIAEEWAISDLAERLLLARKG